MFKLTLSHWKWDHYMYLTGLWFDLGKFTWFRIKLPM